MRQATLLADETDPPKRTLAGAAYERLRQDILRCVLPPGERLRLHQLAATYGFGVGAIREALARLTGDGLVLAEEQRGFAVSAVSREHLLDLLQMRLLLEEEALRRSIALGGVDWEVEVMSAFHRLSKVSERHPSDLRIVDPEWELNHTAFHSALVSACGSPLLLQTRQGVYEQGQRYRHYYLAYVAGKRDHVAEHRKIMEVALGRKSEEAVSLLREHLKITVDSLLAHGMPGTKNVGTRAVRSASNRRVKEKAWAKAGRKKTWDRAKISPRPGE